MKFSEQDATRDAVINVRLCAAEKVSLQTEAQIAGLSMSELVRRRYFGRPILASADLAMIRELRRIGGLLKHVHVESNGAYSELTASVLVELKSGIRRLAHDR